MGDGCLSSIRFSCFLFHRKPLLESNFPHLTHFPSASYLLLVPQHKMGKNAAVNLQAQEAGTQTRLWREHALPFTLWLGWGASSSASSLRFHSFQKRQMLNARLVETCGYRKIGVGVRILFRGSDNVRMLAF